MAGKKQFDVDVALDRAMVTFWRAGFAGTSMDDLQVATGLNRSSIYQAFGDKQALFMRCLSRYASRYAQRYEAALGSSEDPVRAVQAFYDVTLDRIADADLPQGCFAAQTVMAAPALPDALAREALAAVDAQRSRLRTMLARTAVPADLADSLAFYLFGVNQALAVLSTGAVTPDQLRSIVSTATATLTQVLAA